MTRMLQRAAMLHKEAVRIEQDGNAVGHVVTAFPKSPPPPGVKYSKNFARFQQNGRFAIQERT